MNTPFSRPSGVVLGAEPRANLLPPEVRDGARFRAIRNIVAVLVIVTVVVVGVGYLGAAFRASQAVGGLANAEQRTAVLQAEKLKFADATAMENGVATITDARFMAVSSEILWDKIYDPIVSYLPAGISLVSGTMSGRAPWQPLVAPGGVLRPDRVATLSLVLQSGAIIQQTEIVRALNGVPGYADASADALTLNDDVYQMTVTLNLSKAALSGRFAEAVAEASE